MEKLFIDNVDLTGKKVLMRVDFNVPLDSEGNVADATRIEAALPSIQYVLDQGGALILMSHLGRPQNAPDPALSLAPIAKVLAALLNRPVEMAPNCIGEKVQERVQSLSPGDILLLENLRFHRAETHPEEDPTFAKELASYGDIYVNDAFGTAHRKHSSTYTIAQYFPSRAAAGFLLKKEIHFLGDMLTHPSRPFYALLGGAKISTKIGIIKNLLQKADRLLIGGGMSYTFLKAQGHVIGNSLVEEELIPLAKELLETAGEKIVLPRDILVAKECSEEAPAKLIDLHQEEIPDGYEGLDMGPQTIELFSELLGEAKTLLWNGPVGVYELKRFAKGTITLARRIGELNAISLVGGGDLIAALNQAEVSDQITHVSTGGGAALEYLEYGTLPGIEALSGV
ncbi:MAG: Bifunctional PGK/TIM [Chlamydiales bacterium]|nr:Bifunctional PGK/TIM [Chlamydiales bacterium]